MKRIFMSFLLCFMICFSWAQINDFNSICVWNSDSCSVFQNARVDSITFSHDSQMQDIWIDGKMKPFEIAEIDSVSFFNLYDSDITSYIVDGKQLWEEIYTTPIGTFAYNSVLKYNDTEVADQYEVLSYMGEDWVTSACVLYEKEYHLPVRLVSDSVMVYFSYDGDSIVSVMIGGNTCMDKVGEYELDLGEVNKAINEHGYTSILKERIFKLLSCLQKDDISDANILLILNRFESLLDVPVGACLNKDKDETKYIILVNVYDSGDEPKKKGKGNILYSAVVATNGYYDLTATSCRASGSVYVAYSHYNEDCSYGILVDEDPDNLYYGKAAYCVPGHQEPLSLRFFVNVSGLEPSTKYYYRAYLRIDPKKYPNSPLVIKYDNGNREEEGYDPKRPTLTYGDIESFTTSPPDISGTWTCTETHYDRLGNPVYETYTITLEDDGTVSLSNNDNVLSSSYGISSSGKVTVRIMDLATQTVNSGMDWIGQVDDMSNPQKITGTVSRWNYNQNGFFGGDGYYFEMTR